MSLDKMVEEIKNRPGFTENAGMLAIHNGFVRGTSTKSPGKVIAVEVFANELKIGELCQEAGSRPGIFAVTAQANQGRLTPGQDLLILIVAGDTRAHVLPVFEELLNRIKSEAVEKREIMED